MPTHSHGTVEVTGDAGSGAAYWPRWYAANWIIKAA